MNSRPTRARLPLAVALLAGAASILALPVSAQQAKTLRVAMHGDVRSIDPVWTSQTIATIHGNMIYDKLFDLDEKLEPKPQLIEKWTLSEDRKHYTFTLRPGVKFHDGTPVTTRDVIPSIKRWSARRNAGKILMEFTDSITATDDRTFEWKLNQPFSLVIETLAQVGAVYVMREKEATVDPFQQITEAVGSGPFMMKRDEWMPGSKTVYTKFADYIPRKEAPSGHSGGKVAKVDRVEFVWMADPQTAQSALVAGEIDYLENPQPDFLPMLESAPGVKLITHPAQGTMGIIGVNHLHPPFNNVKARQAMFHIVNNQDFLDTIAADKKLQKPCYSYYGCGVPMETDAGSETYKAKPDYAKAEQLFKEAGYKGEPITILQASDHQYISPAGQVLVQQMRRAGFLKLDVQTMDWGSVVTRRTKKDAPAEGGWNLYITGTTVLGSSSPVSHVGLGMGCEKAWFGWPCDAKMEELRQTWSLTPDLPTRKSLAVEISKRAYEQVPYISFAQWVNPVAYREDLISGVIPVPSVPAMWNIEKK